ncbi:membrane protein [Roseibacillus persicicus]|uniref:Membrane protein n=2 Tax=Roseibacillus persicicus TaxID=454148 RepID=A0A918WIZ4_9BACT|nr:membrane protein [Roseibacillus persicicus]
MTRESSLARIKTSILTFIPLNMRSIFSSGFFAVLLTLPLMGDPQSDEPDIVRAEPFVHPGLLHSQEDLAFTRSKLTEQSEPWQTAWTALCQSEQSSLDYTPRPRAHVIRGARNNPDQGSSDFTQDGGAAYNHALQWALSGKKAHAEKAMEILNAWSFTLESIGGHDAKLLVGMDGVIYCNAAELIRHSDADWPAEEQARFERMLREIFYPLIKDFYPSANGNWDAAMIQTMLAMGVFLDDRPMFERALHYFRAGEGNGAVNNYLNEFGQCQESGRDQLHVQMGLGFLGVACEIAWKQGVDLYGFSNNRLATGFEYTAKYNLGEEVPFKRFRSYQGRYDYSEISDRGRGRFRPIYERIVHHYTKRRDLELPWSVKVAEQQRPEGAHEQHASWGTLTSFGVPLTDEVTP